MQDRLLEELKIGLQGCIVDGGRELYHILGCALIPTSRQCIEQLAHENLSGLAYELHDARWHATGVSSGDIMVCFPSSNHFISLGTQEKYATINILWRGRRIENDDERAKYVAFLRRYFTKG